MNEKLDYLKEIRGVIGEEQFKFCAASIVANHFLELMKYKGKKVNRMELLTRVNLMMYVLGCDSVSYGFLRKFEVF